MSAALDALEAEAIYILREAVGQAERPVLLYSMGKDSAVLLDLVRRAFYPQPPPLPLLHVDTGWKFAAMYAVRDQLAADPDVTLLIHRNPEAVARGINPFDHGAAHTDLWKTQGLRQALELHRFDVAIGGARRDEERSRAKERVFSFRGADHRWDAADQRPELWHSYNGRCRTGESFRVFPLSNWTELDVWKYIAARAIPVCELYFAAPRPVVERNGSLMVRDDDRLPVGPDELVTHRSVRFRTLGCYPLTAAIPSNAATIDDIIDEVRSSLTSERAGRLIDHGRTSMEWKKREGYF